MLVITLTIVDSHDEALVAVTGLVDAAEATRNPYALSLALLADGFAYRELDPGRALDALRRGLAIAQDSGNHAGESNTAMILGRAEAERGDPLAVLEYTTLAIRNYHNSGYTAVIRVPVAWLAIFLDRLGRSEAAATLAGFAFSPLIAASFRELETATAHLRDVLGDLTYESLAREGETMTTADLVAYAYDQIDQARAELKAVSK